MVDLEESAFLAASSQSAHDLLRRGHVQQAEVICREILARHPGHFQGLHLLGVIALQKRSAAEAVSLLRAATQAEPGQSVAWSNLAAALLGAQQPAEAVVASDTALGIDPRLLGGLINRGAALSALGRHEESLAAYQRAQSVSPQSLDAYTGSGKALRMLGRFEESLVHYERARRIDPGSTAILVDIAQTQLQLRRPESALEVLAAALRLDATSVDALCARGSALRQLQRPSEALASYEAALRAQPNLPGIHANIANVHLYFGRVEDCLSYCDRALALDPRHSHAANIRAHALRALGHIEEAALAFDRLIEIAPDFDYARGNRLYMRAWICDWTNYAREVAILHSAVAVGKRACQPLSFMAFCGESNAQLACARISVADRYLGGAPKQRLPRLRRDLIRVAYVSSDFKDHPVAHLLAGVLETHDRRRFRTHALSIESQPLETPMRSRIRTAVDCYEDLSQMSDREAGARLQALDIDIAVDLNGHTQSGRLGIFATRPAPVQVGYLGYNGTTGADYIDYLLADQVALPTAMETDFSEKIVRLPYCFLPNDDRQRIALPTPSREAAGLPARGFVYCAFSSPYKITPTVFDVWMRLLAQTSDSVLWLKAERPTTMENLRHEARARGIDAERLVFAPPIQQMHEHLARYRCADLFLDTLPYGAHATSRDALWAGLPVLTCAGRAFASRVAASLLTSLGLTQLITTSLDEYAERAIRLATAPNELSALRDTLASTLPAAPTFSTSRYCRALEAAFEAMFERHQSEIATRSLSV